MINILIRTSDRPELFRRCIESISKQTYQDLKLIIAYDTDKSNRYINEVLQDYPTLRANTKLRFDKQDPPFHYNTYCNAMLNWVFEGWAFFLDDDDYLHDSKSLEHISQHFGEGKVIICQFERNGKPKPADSLMDAKRIESGRIGLPCIFIEHSMIKSNFEPVENADYLWIKQFEPANPVFVKQVVVVSEKRNHGQPA